MVRWIRIYALGILALAMVAIGIAIGLFIVANGTWVAVDVPPRLTGVLGDPKYELSVPGLMAGWLVAVAAVVVVVIWSMYYVWRRRQYESLIRRLENELADLRNLPFTAPAPLEDLPETPDSGAAQILAAVETDFEFSEAESG
jgi:hypothetical protein